MGESASGIPRVIVVGGELTATGSAVPIVVEVDVTSGPVQVDVVNSTPILVELTTIDSGVTLNASSRGVINYFVDENNVPIPVKTAFAVVSSNGDNDLVAAVAAKKIRVLGYQMQGQGTVSANFQGNDVTQLSMVWQFQAREGVVVNCATGGFLFETAAGVKLGIFLSTNVAVAVQVQYLEVD